MNIVLILIDLAFKSSTNFSDLSFSKFSLEYFNYFVIFKRSIKYEFKSPDFSCASVVTFPTLFLIFLQ